MKKKIKIIACIVSVPIIVVAFLYAYFFFPHHSVRKNIGKEMQKVNQTYELKEEKIEQVHEYLNELVSKGKLKSVIRSDNALYYEFPHGGIFGIQFDVNMKEKLNNNSSVNREKLKNAHFKNAVYAGIKTDTKVLIITSFPQTFNFIYGYNIKTPTF